MLEDLSAYAAVDDGFQDLAALFPVEALASSAAAGVGANKGDTDDVDGFMIRSHGLDAFGSDSFEELSMLALAYPGLMLSWEASGAGDDVDNTHTMIAEYVL